MATTRQLGFVVEVGQYPAGQVDIPAGHGERVDDRLSRHLDVISQIRLWLSAPNVFAEAGDITGQVGVFVFAVGLQYLRFACCPIASSSAEDMSMSSFLP